MVTIMKNLDKNTVFESNNTYLCSSCELLFTLADTQRVTDEKYLTVHEGAVYIDVAFFLQGLRNVVLDFGGAVLRLRGRIQPFLLDECENVTIRNVTVEYERSLFTELDVVRNTRDTLVVRQKKKFPCRVENGHFIPFGEDYEDRDLYKKGCMFIQAFHRQSGAGMGLDVIYLGENIIPEDSPPASNIKHVKVKEDGENFVLYGAFPSHWDENTVIALEHENRFKSSAAVLHCKDVLVENYRILNGCGMGIFALCTENIRLDSYKLYRDEKSHGIVTNSADGVHFVACKGMVHMENCIFEGMIDDALNIHSNFYSTVSGKGNTLVAERSQASHALNAYSQVFHAGDTIAVYNGHTMEEKARFVLRKVKITDRWTVQLETDSTADFIAADDLIENISTNPEILIRNCRFGKANTHLRFQSRGKTVIENCEFELPVLLTGDMDYWFEASPVQDFTLQNCNFTTERANVRIEPSFTPTGQAPFYHRNIKILNNRFVSSEPLLQHDADNVMFEENEIVE